MNVKLRPHQREALKKLKNGNILWGGVGTGKSRVALAYYEKHEKPKNLIVITTAKKRDSLDWEGEASLYGIGKAKDATVSGVLTVDSWNNIDKYSGLRDTFFIFDEQRLVGSGVWTKAFLRIARHNPWILLTATPGDNWLDYIPVFLANGFYKNRTAFKREHVIYSAYAKFPKVERYVGVNRLVRLRNQILVEMPYDNQTVRHGKTITVDYDPAKFEQVFKHRWNPYEDRPARDLGELYYLMRRVVSEDSSRVEAVRKLSKKHPRLIVFYNFNFELDALRELSSQVTVAEWNGHKHEPIPSTDRWVYLVQYVAGSEGWNCTSTDAMVFYSLTYSYKNFEQAHGRIDRMNTPFTDLWYYSLRSNSYIDRAVWKSLKAKKNFQPVKEIRI